MTVEYLIKFLLSAASIVLLGTYLTKCADEIAELTGWGKKFVGALLLAGATSLPELFVDLKAVRENLPDLAVGDLMGSSLFNLMILAILDFTYPSAFRRTAFSRENLHHSLSAVLAILLVGIIGAGISSKIQSELMGVNVFIWATVFVYFYGMRLIFIEGEGRQTSDNRAETSSLATLITQRHFQKSFLGYLAACILLMLVSPILVESADHLAQISGLGHSFLGTTAVAITTSLPELVATLAAFRLGSPDLALGNILGSNSFNMILFFPLDVVFGGSLLEQVSQVHAVTAFGVIGVMSVAVMGQLYRKKEKSHILEPSSEIILGLTLLILFVIFQVKELS